MGVEEPYRWKDSVQSEPEIQLWVAEGTANGMRPWVTKFSGVLYDRRWLPVVERIYDWHYRHEGYLRNESPIAAIGLLYSEQTGRYHPGVAAGDRGEDHVLGMYQALIEARMPFELVHEAFLTPDRLDRFKVLVLADAAALSDAQCEAIRRYVDRGGSVVATFASSLYDEWGQQRKDFGLADVFGVSFAGRIEGPMQNSYLNLDPDPSTKTHHAVLRGLEDAPRIINGVFRVEVRPTREFPSPITLVPSYPDLPMEDVYPRVPRTQTRELYLRELGRGRVAYIPWDIDRTFWEVLSPDHGRLLRNVLTWAMNQEPAPVEVDGPRRPRRDHVATTELDDGPPREPDEPDDDERAAAGNHSDRTAHCSGPRAGRVARHQGQAAHRGHIRRASGGRRHHYGESADGGRPRSRRNRPRASQSLIPNP